MSTFKVLLISVSCGTVLLGLVASLSIAFHAELMVPVIALISLPGLAIVIGHVRKASQESKLWTALAIAGILAPLTWLMILWIAFTYSDI